MSVLCTVTVIVHVQRDVYRLPKQREVVGYSEPNRRFSKSDFRYHQYVPRVSGQTPLYILELCPGTQIPPRYIIRVHVNRPCLRMS